MLEICPLSYESLDGVCEIELLSFSEPWSKYSFEKEIENQMAYYAVLKEGETVLGYGGFWVILDEGHITNVAVHPISRKMGCGSKLVQALIDKANELKLRLLTLEVRRSNIGAIKLYEKFGFEFVGERKNYYHNPTEEALLMTKIFMR